ncbi:MAG TPA: NADPH-dependent glutamate synthase [Candidatus Stercoripulliclostridium merdigallinarum]|uniref:NADPH-dependent glutamate synthase n=1 Tax=Candidatus Stercoripulliclostridium merdigallinarum TaxID=2840951 RepID=A0A9D1MJ24_9FIRM|nr:NADPH-dependent glutamate synthase [Candidatus Stercoripulliclostridium merdigallinarum]
MPEPRNIPPFRDAEIRRRNFEEVNMGFDAETAKKEASRCLQCKNPMCRQGCPVGVNIPAFILKIKNGDFEGARDTITADNNLPSICGRVCPQETQCESRCVLGKKFGAVAIGALERFAGDYIVGGKPAVPAEKVGKSVAVIGSGPAGLSCAADLIKRGFDVTIFEAFHTTGGVLSYGIPEFRLPKRIVKAEIASLEKMGVKIVTNAVIGKSLTIAELKEDFDFIFLGTGAGLPGFMNIPGEGLPGVCSANEFLTRVNLMKAMNPDAATPVQRGKNVMVVGAGNVAMDAARTAMRLGADHVTIVYRRSRTEMPARKEEIEHAEEEGIELKLLTSPVEIIGNGKVEKVRLIRTELGEPDERGRRRPIDIPGSEFEVAADEVIMALGTSPNPVLTKSCPELKTGPRGIIAVDEDGRTSVPGVYAGGDAATGAATVILAMSAGKRAAKAIVADAGLN